MPILRRKKVLFIPPPLMTGPPSPTSLSFGSLLHAGSPVADVKIEGEAEEAGKKSVLTLSPSTPVWYMKETGEIFTTYDAYCSRRAFYLQPIFQCEVTGKSGLRFFDALRSERAEARLLESRFPEQLKASVLRSVQFQVVGRLDGLVDRVYERFKDRFWTGERVIVDIAGERFIATICQVFPPRRRTSSNSSNTAVREPAPIHPFPTSLDSPPIDDAQAYFYSVQIVGGASATGLEKDGKEGTPAKREDKREDKPREGKRKSEANGEPEGNRRRSLRQRRQEEERDRLEKKSAPSSSAPPPPATGAVAVGSMKVEEPAVGEGFKGSLMEVTSSQLSRDRLTFSKSILRRYLAATVERGAALASPWEVKPSLCKRYGIDAHMPEARKEEVEVIRTQALGKRKKAVSEKMEERQREKREEKEREEKEREERERRERGEEVDEEEGRLKKRRKSGKKGEEKAEKKAAAEAEKRRKEEEERKRKEEEEAARKAAEEAAAAAAAKKKPVKYPTEDLDVRVNEREKKHGKPLRRPVWKKDVFFVDLGQEVWETFLETWNFLSIFSKPLLLAPFTMDDYAGALRHRLADPPCVLIAETHQALLTLIARDVPGKRHTALISLGVDVPDQLVELLNQTGESWQAGGWERKGRMGWEEALIGCLKEHATKTALPRLQLILEHLLLEDGAIKANGVGNGRTNDGGDLVERVEPTVGTSGTSTTEPPSSPITEISIEGSEETTTTPASPKTRYPTLPIADKLAILRFLTDLAVVSKAVKSFLEAGDGALTELRKEKIELNRERKRVAEELAVLEEKINPPKSEAEIKQAENGEAAAAPEDAESSKPNKGKKADSKIPKADSADTPLGSEEADQLDMDVSPSKSKKSNVRSKLAETPVDSDVDMDVEAFDMEPSSDAGSDTGSPVPANIDRHTSRQKSLLKKHLQREAEEALAAHRRSAARTATAVLRLLHNDKRKLEEEDVRYIKRLEAIEKEFRKLLAAQRQKPLGKDRFHNVIWWFDGMGGMNLTGAGGNFLWQTARVFIQGASEPDRRFWETTENFDERVKEEECETGLLGPGEWAYYDTPEDVEDFIMWLNLKGRREFNLERQIHNWGEFIVGGMRRRANELAASVGRALDTRRSSRVKTGMLEIMREPYMQYTNKKSAHK
ncbi:hypothetical protein DACRYDRAFT_71506 [Dacryopinax primogenitus]|uniref:WAC domain-containing protein n=1 Tax=Dacryopinax primogenitus (strain DJM 731) TaxID=1858805 RepID=M5FRY1_DACPD|nr:uncharacterized protein DACRYDRAFT_71506 [Dacryopinax primogenitus]EJT97839.1 hypothetical protein DACRYDRAFT_71506 [Dacryopinax primogenitus]